MLSYVSSLTFPLMISTNKVLFQGMKVIELATDLLANQKPHLAYKDTIHISPNLTSSTSISNIINNHLSK